MKKPSFACTPSIAQFIKDVPAGAVRIYDELDAFARSAHQEAAG